MLGKVEEKHVFIAWAFYVAYHNRCSPSLCNSFAIWAYLNWRAGKLSLESIDKAAKRVASQRGREDYNYHLREGRIADREPVKWLTFGPEKKEITDKPFLKMFQGISREVGSAVTFYFVFGKNEFTLERARKLAVILNYADKKRTRVLEAIIHRTCNKATCSVCDKKFTSIESYTSWERVPCPACGSKSVRLHDYSRHPSRITLEQLPI